MKNKVTFGEKVIRNLKTYVVLRKIKHKSFSHKIVTLIDLNQYLIFIYLQFLSQKS